MGGIGFGLERLLEGRINCRGTACEKKFENDQNASIGRIIQQDLQFKGGQSTTNTRHKRQHAFSFLLNCPRRCTFCLLDVPCGRQKHTRENAIFHQKYCWWVGSSLRGPKWIENRHHKNERFLLLPPFSHKGIVCLLWIYDNASLFQTNNGHPWVCVWGCVVFFSRKLRWNYTFGSSPLHQCSQSVICEIIDGNKWTFIIPQRCTMQINRHNLAFNTK